jgi:RPA family protein
MSDNNDNSSEYNGRQSAKRVLNAGLTAATHQTQGNENEGEGEDEGEDDSPNLFLLPGGETANRVFVGGILTDGIEDISSDGKSEYLRMVLSDPAGDNVHIYAGQYTDSEVRADMKNIAAPARVLVMGKIQHYERDGRVYVQIRPEEVKEVSRGEYFGFMKEAADHTLDRFEGSRGQDGASEAAQAVYSTDTRRSLLDSATDVLNAMHDPLSEEEETFDRDELEEKEWDELRSLASEFDDVNGNAGKDTLVSALEEKQVPA